MMTDQSARLALPYIQPSQAQKHVIHNEAVQMLDLLVQLVVESFDAAVPPALPEAGVTWALGPAPTGAWAGQPWQLAAWVQGAWMFISPGTGWRAWGREEAALRIWDGTGWVREALDNLDGLGVNAAYDSTNRFAVSAPASLFSHAGDDHQLKINKATAGDTASLLFQTGWSGRAEIGAAGSDDFAIKVSPDGDVWHVGLAIDRTSGGVHVPNGLEVTGAITGTGAANLPALRSDASDTGEVDCANARAVLASLGSRAGGERSLVAASNLCHAESGTSAIVSSTTSTTKQTVSAVVCSSGAETSANQCLVAASLFAENTGARSAILASRRVRNTQAGALVLGDASSGDDPLTANRTIVLSAASGNIQIAGSLTSSHTFSDFAEMFPNASGAEIPLGTIVAEEGGAVRPAQEGDEIAGVVTATAVVTAGDTPFAWQGRYLADEWGRPLFDEVPDPDWEGAGAAPLVLVRRENPDWNPDLPQLPRSERPDQWTRVGLLGQVFARVADDVEPGDRLAAVAGIGVKSAARTGLRCMTITRPFDPERGYAIARCLINVRV